jgi:hypothetical protein
MVKIKRPQQRMDSREKKHWLIILGGLVLLYLITTSLIDEGIVAAIIPFIGTVRFGDTIASIILAGTIGATARVVWLFVRKYVVSTAVRVVKP